MQFFIPKNLNTITDSVNSVHLVYVSDVSVSDFVSNPRSLHCHPDVLELLYCRSGSCKIVIDGIPYFATEGDIVLYNQNSYHQENATDSDNFSLFCIAVKGIKIRTYGENCLTSSAGPHVVHTGDNSDFFESIFSRIFNLVATGAVKEIELAQFYARVVIGEVMELCENQIDNTSLPISDNSEVSKYIYDYLLHNYKKDIRLSDISCALKLSTDYISHLFKSSTGYAPMQFVNALRIGDAQIQLLETNKKISDIAMDVGFNNIGNFNRSFFLYMGITPSAFRKKNQ